LWFVCWSLIRSRVSISPKVGREIGYVSSYRVLGELSVSRAIGDAETKGQLKHDFWDNHTFTDDVISCVPDVMILRRDPELDRFVMLACDGFWDVFEIQEAVELCAQRLALHLTKAPGKC
jgi:serine/threonine protein phosphatase PrpC